MPEFLTLLPPDEARALLLLNLPAPALDLERIDAAAALGRVLAADIVAPHPLPEFERTTVDGYAVRAADTFGAADSLPAYLHLVGEVPMGAEPEFELGEGQCALIHTGGMLPAGASAVVMLEHTQSASPEEIEILRSVAEGENVIRVGEDVERGQVIQVRGSVIGPAAIGGLLALGITHVDVVRKPTVGLISTGDEIVSPAESPRRGQVRDVNTHTLAALVEKSGGSARSYGIVPDQFEALQTAAAKALSECDMVLITAGSSASTRDMTADVIRSLGAPGVLVHGINTRPGKPTILGVCEGKAVIGLPGNPVSALVNGYLFVVPVIEYLTGARTRPRAKLLARLVVNLSSQAGREDWWPVKLTRPQPLPPGADSTSFPEGTVEYQAEPIFGKSNLIFNLADADGLLRIHPDATGLSAGEMVEVILI